MRSIIKENAQGFKRFRGVCKDSMNTYQRSDDGDTQTYLVALGANLPSKAGDAAATLRAAILAFPDHGLGLRKLSRLFATPCFPPGAGPDYVNACAEVTGPRAPEAMLETLAAIETAFGRVRTGRWAARCLDLDLLAAGNRVVPDVATHAVWRTMSLGQQATVFPDQLILPHPRLQERAFVLVPLCDIAPDWRHPILDRTAHALCAGLPHNAVAKVAPRANHLDLQGIKH